MKTIRIIIENTSELALSKRETSTNFIESQSFIRGSRFLGAIGTYLIQQMNLTTQILQMKQNPIDIANKITPKSKVEEWFVQYFKSIGTNNDPLVSFSDAIPMDSEYETQGIYYLPAPKILYECRKFEKEYINTPKDPNEKTQINNHISIPLKNEIMKKLKLLARSSTQPQSQPEQHQQNLMNLLVNDVCPNCGSPMKKKKAEFLKIKIDPKTNQYEITTISPSKSWKMGIAREHSLRSNKMIKKQNEKELKGQLFSMQYLDPGQLFSLTITFDDKKITQQELIDIINTMKIGAKINSGFGDIKVHTDPTSIQEIEIQEIQSAIENNYREWSESKELQEYIPIYCLSDLILTKEAYESTLKKIPGTEVYTIFSSKKRINLFFYNGVQATLNQIDTIERGSVFLIHKKGGFQHADLEIIAQLCYQRIGLLTERGFGQIAAIPEYFLS